jgi:O-antigen ligase
MKLTANIGSADRIARFALGLILVALALTGSLGVWAWIGVVPLATAFVRFCPAYALLGVRTCSEC